MAIGPIDYAMIQRTNDVEMYKMQEETKPFVDQQNIQVQVAAHEKMQSEQVVTSQDSKQTKNDADARKEGRGHPDHYRRQWHGHAGRSSGKYSDG